ncbi:MAG: PTS sugar transporter subunit IIA [Phycisphaerales bacterium]|nr:PTS sugar transporter subunit IIA [Phycisphaerales bacterium]
MKLSDILDQSDVIVPLRSCERAAALDEILRHLATRNSIRDPGPLLAELLKNDEIDPFDRLPGAALAHLRTSMIDRPLLAVGTFTRRVHWSTRTPDGVAILFVLLAPESEMLSPEPLTPPRGAYTLTA